MGFFGNLLKDISGRTSRNAAKKQEVASVSAINDIRQGRDDATNLLTPLIEGGDDARQMRLAAAGVLGPEAQAEFFSAFQDDPGFQAALDEGVRTIDSGAASAGLLRSGARANALFDFGSDLRLDAFRNRLSDLEGLSREGDAARGVQAGNIQTASANTANLRRGIGEAQANGIIGAGNARLGTTQFALELGANALGRIA